MTFTTTVGNVTVTTTLWGDVSYERETRERAIATHRAFQLGPPPQVRLIRDLDGEVSVLDDISPRRTSRSN